VLGGVGREETVDVGAHEMRALPLNLCFLPTF